MQRKRAGKPDFAAIHPAAQESALAELAGPPPPNATAAYHRKRRVAGKKVSPVDAGRSLESLPGSAGGKGKKRLAPADGEDDEGTEYLTEPPSKKAKTHGSDDQSETSDKGDTDWPTDVNELARVSHIDDDFTYDGEKANLEAILEVYSDPWGLRSRVGYRLQLLLVRNGGPGKGKKRAETPEPARIGYIHAWRVDNFTDTVTDKPAFRREMWAMAGPDMFKKKDEFTGQPIEMGHKADTALMMQALYNKNGTVKAALRKRKGIMADGLLLNNRIIFIEAVHVYPEFQRQKHFGRMLQYFADLIRHRNLPEWFRFQGTIVLSPGPLNSSKSKTWGDMPYEDIVDTLVPMYEEYGGYEDWGSLKVHGSDVRVMIRSVAYEENESFDDDEDDGE